MKYRKYLATSLLVLVVFLFLLPLIITFGNSWMSETEITQNYAVRPDTFDLADGISERYQVFKLIPGRVTFRQYYEVLLKQPSFMMLLTNSLKIAVPVTVGSLVVSMLTAYGLAIWKWRYKEILFQVYVIVMLMPLQAVLVPNYIIADLLHIKDNYLAIILPGVFSPFGVFLMYQAMKVVPAAYFEAARIDGAGNLYIFWHIIVPQLKSQAAALCMLVFIEYWNLVEQAVVFIKEYAREPLSVYLSRIAGTNKGLVFAASSIYLLLPLWLVVAGQENLEKGIELSGVK